jgi:hypothetical protein
MKRFATITISLIAFSCLGSAAVAGVLSATPDNGTDLSSATVPVGYSGLNDHALQSCMDQKKVCNSTAAGRAKQVWSSPLAPNENVLNRVEVEQLIRKDLGISSAAPVFTEALTGAAAEVQVGMLRGATTDPTRPVWIVTVKTPTMTDGGPGTPPRLMQYYSAIVDAASGQVTDDCIGCSWLSANK